MRCTVILITMQSQRQVRERRCREADTILFGKYQLCRVLGCGRSGTVFLARHMELDEYRAIKRVPKTFVNYELFRREALILKGIRDQAIPIVYDLAEDDQYSYLIEEYLEGDSLYALVTESGHCSSAMTIQYGIQICHLVHIMHSTMPTPVLYLDLQPKNLLLYENTIKLIDFDHAVYADEAAHMVERYGTIGCAAPEQYSGDVLDGRTDIYAIGAVLHYMLTGHFPGEDIRSDQVKLSGITERRLMCIIRKCLQKEKNRRFQNVKELEERLQKLWNQSECGAFRYGVKRMEESLVIAVAGSRRGVGTTHIAMGLTAYLQRCGLPAVYEEHNESGAVRQLMECRKAAADSCGIVRIWKTPMLPCYGKAVEWKPSGYRIRILDCGTDLVSFKNENADGYLLLCGGKPWEWENSGEAVNDCDCVQGLTVLYNLFCDRLSFRRKFPATGGLRMPYFSDPFLGSYRSDHVYRTIWNRWFGQRGETIRNVFSG